MENIDLIESQKIYDLIFEACRCSKNSELICFNLSRLLSELYIEYCIDQTKESLIDVVSKIYDAVLDAKKREKINTQTIPNDILYLKEISQI